MPPLTAPEPETGRMLEILHYPHPKLRIVAEPVEVIDDAIRRLAAEMIETMYAARGVGLAATQVGVPLRLLIVDTDPRARDPRVLINPVLVRRSRHKVFENEGCLSVPGIEAKVKRYAEATVEAQDLDGRVVEYGGEGLLARALQHEIDHLDGLLFLDKISSVTRFALRHDIERLEADYRRTHGA